MKRHPVFRAALRALFSLVLILSLLFPAALAETGGSVFQFDEKGFLVGDNPAEEYLLEDEENGFWQYASRDLAVTVTRTREKAKNKKTVEYCIAEIHCTESSPMGSIMTEPYSRYGSEPAPGVRQEVPTVLLEAHPSVLAFSDDMYGLRLSPIGRNRTKYDYHGVIIRDGAVLATKTRKSPEEGKRDRRPWPNLDAMAVYADGSMKTFVSGDKTAEEYLADGAVNVLAFGPWLISGGELNPALLNKDYYPASEPRVAIGMVEPYHYIVIAASGRPKEKYQGVKLLWLAEALQARGCTEALNLDGGATVLMAFNNKVILKGQNSKGFRNLGSLLAFGLKGEE